MAPPAITYIRQVGGVQGSGSSFDSQGTAGDSPPPGRPVSAGLLCLAALLLLAASLMPFLTWKYAGMRTGRRVELQIQRDAWRYRYGGVTADRAEYHTAAQYLWIPLLLCGCAATAVAALLYLRTRRRGPQPRSGAGYLAAGTTFGVAVATFAAVLPPSNRQQDGDYTFSSGLWALVLAAIVAAAVVLKAVAAPADSFPSATRRADTRTGIALVLTAVAAVPGALLDLLRDEAGGYSFSAWRIGIDGVTLWRWDFLPLLAGALLALLTGLALCAGRAARAPAIRGVAAVAAGTTFAMTLTALTVAASYRLDGADVFFDFGPFHGGDYAAGCRLLACGALAAAAAMVSAALSFRR